ncbi:unnamed protein product [Albugo candida]|uniref:Uncharacterized protein n=1 Tax=Albugo candida TaxID=65357 RepID=A0A024FTD6_9STRA|nr:unnamed protein product [Albugo candida]|eukprot:CCI10167.1 unnamed protein product [Albugo candida]
MEQVGVVILKFGHFGCICQNVLSIAPQIRTSKCVALSQHSSVLEMLLVISVDERPFLCIQWQRVCALNIRLEATDAIVEGILYRFWKMRHSGKHYQVGGSGAGLFDRCSGRIAGL